MRKEVKSKLGRVINDDNIKNIDLDFPHKDDNNWLEIEVGGVKAPQFPSPLEVKMLIAQALYKSLDVTPYNQKDHSHCWSETNPPCGQKIEHLYCCICEKLNPKVEMVCKDGIEDRVERQVERSKKHKGT